MPGVNFHEESGHSQLSLVNTSDGQQSVARETVKVSDDKLGLERTHVTKVKIDVFLLGGSHFILIKDLLKNTINSDRALGNQAGHVSVGVRKSGDKSTQLIRLAVGVHRREDAVQLFVGLATINGDLVRDLKGFSLDDSGVESEKQQSRFVASVERENDLKQNGLHSGGVVDQAGGMQFVDSATNNHLSVVAGFDLNQV